MIRSFDSSSFLTSSRSMVSFYLSFSITSMKSFSVSTSFVRRFMVSSLFNSLSLDS